mmetsp:Transcript_15062/g.35508  ORF Transcript_15062/g.35508 Transcript_15062/m.35508 type:complete len:88 (-) Transcript_15062:1411-1674(-)
MSFGSTKSLPLASLVLAVVTSHRLQLPSHCLVALRRHAPIHEQNCPRTATATLHLDVQGWMDLSTKTNLIPLPLRTQAVRDGILRPK